MFKHFHTGSLSLKPQPRPDLDTVMQPPKPLHQANSHIEGKTAFPPDDLCISGIYTADIASRVHQFFPDMSVTDFECWRSSYGPL